MSDQNLLLQLSKINAEQSATLAEVKTGLKHNGELLKKHDEVMDKLVQIVTTNTEDLKYHIKRTDILQSRQYKIIILLAVAMGVALSIFGPSVLKFLGLLL